MNEKQKATLHPFTALLRAYENAHASGTDTTAPLLALAKACASSVVRKCLDPQKKTACEKPVTADGRTDTTQADRPHKLTGSTNKAMEDLRIGIMADFALLENLHTAINNATAFHYNADGNYIREIVDHDAEDAVNAIIGETLSDGIDLVNTAVVAILEQTEKHSGIGNWLEKPYTHRVLSKRVYIKSTDSAHWKEEETTPIREVYRAIRRAIQNSKAIQADPKNGYLYIEDTAHDPETGALEAIYHRLNKWSDLGGNDCNGHYTADKQTTADYETMLEKLNLTDKQARIVSLRMRGYGYPAIGTYLGITKQAVLNTIKKVQAKAEAMSFVPVGQQKERIDRENNIREVIAMLAEADKMEGAEIADTLRNTAYDTAEKYGITSCMIALEKKVIAREISADIRKGNHEDNETILDQAYDTAEKYGITSCMLTCV